MNPKIFHVPDLLELEIRHPTPLSFPPWLTLIGPMRPVEAGIDREGGVRDEGRPGGGVLRDERRPAAAAESYMLVTVLTAS